MSATYGINIAQAEKDLHPVFKTDPKQLWNLVNKKVILTTSEGLVFEGWVYTIDPVTHNWVLFVESADNTNPTLQLVMNASVTDVKVTNSDCPDFLLQIMTKYGETNKVELSAAELIERRDAVCRWFGVNRIPVVKSEETLSIANGVLKISPPYYPENCYSSNEIILSKVKNLLSSLPHNDNMTVS